MHSTLRFTVFRFWIKNASKVAIYYIISFLFFNTADAQAPVRPLEPAFKAMENEDWDKAFLLADKDGDLGYSIILWHYLRERFRKTR